MYEYENAILVGTIIVIIVIEARDHMRRTTNKNTRQPFTLDTLYVRMKWYEIQRTEEMCDNKEHWIYGTDDSPTFHRGNILFIHYGLLKRTCVCVCAFFPALFFCFSLLCHECLVTIDFFRTSHRIQLLHIVDGTTVRTDGESDNKMKKKRRRKQYSMPSSAPPSPCHCEVTELCFVVLFHSTIFPLSIWTMFSSSPACFFASLSLYLSFSFFCFVCLVSFRFVCLCVCVCCVCVGCNSRPPFRSFAHIFVTLNVDNQDLLFPE